MEQLVYIILFLLVVVLVYGLVKTWHNNLPKWTKVKFYIVDENNFGMSREAIKQGLIERFKLEPHHAELCLNNYEDDYWLQMQSFLADEPSI